MASRYRPTLTDEEVAKARADLRAWRAKQHEAAVRYAKRSHRRRNDGPWRTACIELYGHRCLACGSVDIEVDHILPRSHSGASDVRNGLILCGQWSATVPGGHHGMKTAGALKIRHEWLAPAQLEYLAERRWVDWDEYGQPFGEGYKHFAPRG